MSLTLSRVSYQATLAEITLVFPRGEDDEVHFDNRTEPDLPKEIRGKARWVEANKHYPKAHYEACFNDDQWEPVEFLNKRWYWIYRESDHWTAAKSDKVNKPREFGLGTQANPYLESPDQKRLRLEEEASDTTSPKEQSRTSLENDEPTVDLTEEEHQLEQALAQIMLEPISEETTLINQEEYIPGSQYIQDEPMSATTTYAPQIAYTQITTRSSSFGMGTDPNVGSSRGSLPTGGTTGGTSGPTQAGGGNVGSSGPTGAVPSGQSGTTSGMTQGGMQSSHPTSSGGGHPSGGTGLPTGPPAGGPPGGQPPPPPPGGNLPAQQAVQGGPVPPPNGALKGHPPEIFDGQRANAIKFSQEFGLWRICNSQNESMTNPFQRVALALSYIKGPRVDDWVAQQMNEAATKVYNNIYLEMDE